MVKKALLVGINDYAPVGAGGPDLRGCINDVRDVAHTLTALGIVPPHPKAIRILTNARATRANILEGLKWLLTGAKKQNVLIFYYSGHGSQLPDFSGEEVDHKDETICPHDYETSGMLKDDDLWDIFKNIPNGVNLEVIIDSCHSGTGTREIPSLTTISQEEQIKYRYVEPPVDYAFFLEVNPTLPTKGILKPLQKEVTTVEGLNHVLWAACRDYQTAAEAPIHGRWRGVFTYCFCKTLRRTGPRISRKRLESLVSAYIRKMGYSQVPQLEGTEKSINEQVFT